MKFFRLGLVIIAVVAFSLAAILSIEPEPPQEIEIKITPYQEMVESEIEQPQSELKEAPEPVNHLIRVHYFVKVGDTLSNVFASWQLPYETAQKILEADLETLKLDTIKPGDHLELLVDRETRRLVELTYHESLIERSVYSLNDDGSFDYEFIELPGQWKEKIDRKSVV